MNTRDQPISGFTRQKSDDDLLQELIREFYERLDWANMKPDPKTIHPVFNSVEKLFLTFSHKIDEKMVLVIRKRLDFYLFDYYGLMLEGKISKNKYKVMVFWLSSIKRAFCCIMKEIKK